MGCAKQIYLKNRVSIWRNGVLAKGGNRRSFRVVRSSNGKAVSLAIAKYDQGDATGPNRSLTLSEDAALRLSQCGPSCIKQHCERQDVRKAR